MSPTTLFPNTKKALELYDAGEPARELAWARVQTDAAVAECLRNDTRAVKAVQFAFYQDTRHFNSLDTCQVVPISDIRRLVAEFHQS